jgi:hypothetical protein
MTAFTSRGITRSALVAVTTVALAATTVAPAVAATGSTRDATGEVADADIAKVRVNNKQRSMVVKTIINDAVQDIDHILVGVDPGRIGGTRYSYMAEIDQTGSPSGVLFKIKAGDFAVLTEIDATVRERVNAEGEKSTIVKVKLPHRHMAKKARAHRVFVGTFEGDPNQGGSIVDYLDTEDGLTKKIRRG